MLQKLMSIKQLASQTRQLEDRLRRHGVEGEEAFYALAFRYVVHFDDLLKNPPERLVSRGKAAFQRIEDDAGLVAFLDWMILPDNAGENLPIWYQHFVGRRFREGSGKFFTPRPIASAMANLIPRKSDAVVMDPTCGGGTFLLEASRTLQALPCHLVGNDIEQSLADLAGIVLDLGTPDNHKKSFITCNIYDPDSRLTDWYGRVDYILANPPFSLHIDAVPSGSVLFALGYRNSDALFLDVCVNLLRRGGRLVCLLPHSIVANAEFTRLRAAIEESWVLRGVIGMPEGAFHVTASTTTRADIVILDKRDGRRGSDVARVFAFSPAVGIPLNGRMRDVADNDLMNIARDPSVVAALGTEPGA